VHPATDTLLRYLSPEIEWEFVGIDERWREDVKVVLRKRPTKHSLDPSPDGLRSFPVKATVQT
jgi:hypothetical protein